MGSILDAVAIPFGSVDIAVAGLVDSFNFVLTSVNALVADVFAS